MNWPSCTSVRPEQVFAANGSNEVLQSICLAYGGAGRKAAMFEPTYALHSHIAHLTGTEIVQGQRRPDFTLDAGAAVELIETEAPVNCLPLLAQQPDRAGRGRGHRYARSSPPQTGLTVRRRGLWPVRCRGPPSSWSSDDVPLVVVRTYSKTWSMAALRLGYLIGPPEVVKVLERVALPYHLDALKQAAGRLALQFSAQMEQRVAWIIAERDRLVGELSKMPVQVWPSQANFVLWRPLRRSGEEVWQGLVQTFGAGARHLELARAGGLPTYHGRHQRRKRQVPVGTGGGTGMTEGNSGRRPPSEPESASPRRRLSP